MSCATWLETDPTQPAKSVHCRFRWTALSQNDVLRRVKQVSDFAVAVDSVASIVSAARQHDCWLSHWPQERGN